MAESQWDKEIKKLSHKPVNELLAELLMEMRFFNLNFTNIIEDQLDLHDQWEAYNKRNPKATVTFGEYKRQIKKKHNMEDLRDLSEDVDEGFVFEDDKTETKKDSKNKTEEKYKS